MMPSSFRSAAASRRALRLSFIIVLMIGAFTTIAAFGTALASTAHHPAAGVSAQGQPLASCAGVQQLRVLQTAVPQEPRPTVTPVPNPTATPVPPTPRPAPSEDRVGFPQDYPNNFKLLFVFDRPDNRQVRVICGNEAAAAHKAGEPFAYGSVLVMETWRARLDDKDVPVLDENGHYIREALTGIFVQRKEKGFGEAYLEDRSGEWEYVAYRPDGKSLIPPARTNACASCHLRQAGEQLDFAFRMDMYHKGEAAMQPAKLGANEVNIFIYDYMPMEFKVKAGTTITWINNDEAEHTVTAKDKSFDSGALKTVNIQPGASFSLKFDKPGTYEYFCSIHPRMIGKIVVE
jgi:plastocyanin